MLLDNMDDACKSKLKVQLLPQRLVTMAWFTHLRQKFDKLLKDLKLINFSTIHYRQRCEDFSQINFDKFIRHFNLDLNLSVNLFINALKIGRSCTKLIIDGGATRSLIPS